MNREQILVTASDNIPFSEIEQYLGVVDSQIVVGANIFRDVFAGWRDLFGGETKGYKKDIDKMKNAAIASIKNQAQAKEANAIISLKIDLDELSGSGKSMFMINVYGSAVRLKETALSGEVTNDIVGEFTKEDIEYYKERNRLKYQMNATEDIFTEIDLTSISHYKLWSREITSSVLLSANNVHGDYHYKQEQLKKSLPEIPIPFIEEFLTHHIEKLNSKLWKQIYSDLKERGWFNHTFLRKLLDDENYIKRFRALGLCLLQKSYYKGKDSQKLRDLGEFMTKDFNSSVPTKEVSNMLGSKEIFTCPNCLKERKKDKSCECQANQYGLKHTPQTIGQSLIETAEAIDAALGDMDRLQTVG